MTKTVIQTINAPVSGIVAAGDVTIDNTVHHHGPVYVRSAAHTPPYWGIAALVIFTLGGVAASLAMMPSAPTYSTPTVPMIGVQSNAIKAVGYDSETHKLFIEFVEGKHAYTYCNVPEDLYDGMMAAKSKGGYYHQWFWNGKYGC